MDYQPQRTNLIEWTKSQLIGFDFKDNMLVGTAPLDRFFTGILFPVFKGENGFDDTENDIENGDEETAQPVKNEKRYIPPSSAGFSFYITGSHIKLRIFHQAVCYQKQSERDVRTQQFARQRWLKQVLEQSDGEDVEFTLHGVEQYPVFDGKARIDAIWRRYLDGYIVTISISNTQNIDEAKDYHQEINEKALFEVVLKCIVEPGVVGNYPTTNKELLSIEEKEIELRYKDIRTYAVGHGTGVGWKKMIYAIGQTGMEPVPPSLYPMSPE